MCISLEGLPREGVKLTTIRVIDVPENDPKGM